MGLFDLLSPPLSIFDAIIRAMLPQWASLALWGVLGAVISSWLYKKCSRQDEIRDLKIEAAQALRALIDFDGDFDAMLPLAWRSLRLSFRRLRLTAGPLLVTSIPLLCLVSYLSNSYGYLVPTPGSTVEVRIVPGGDRVRWTSTQPQFAPDDGTWSVVWPSEDNPIDLYGPRGSHLATFPMREPVPSLRKFAFWNCLFGNPAGYIPKHATVSVVHVEFEKQQFLRRGPEWFRGWEGLFFMSSAMFSFLLKVAFRIH